MVWGAAYTGFYVDVPGGQVQCQPRIIVNPGSITADLDPGESRMVVGSELKTVRCRVIGVPRPGYMASFRASFARNFGGAEVVVGFIQTLTSSTRIAFYGEPSSQMKMWRDPRPIGTGLLDCGATDRPWFQGSTARLLPAVPGRVSPPAMVDCGDNPRWSIPNSVRSRDMQSTELSLSTVELRNSFLLFAVACVGQKYFPICRTRWETNITWSSVDGLHALVTNSVPWGAVSAQDKALLITDPNSRTANDTLTDALVHG